MLCFFVVQRAIINRGGYCLIPHIFPTLFLFFLFVFSVRFTVCFFAILQVWLRTFTGLAMPLYSRFYRCYLLLLLIRHIRTNCVCWCCYWWCCFHTYPSDYPLPFSALFPGPIVCDLGPQWASVVIPVFFPCPNPQQYPTVPICTHKHPPWSFTNTRNPLPRACVFFHILHCFARWPGVCLHVRLVCLPACFGVSPTYPNPKPQLKQSPIFFWPFANFLEFFLNHYSLF